jgi:hypothetical protein
MTGTTSNASLDLAPYAPKRFVAKVPPSLVSALKSKMTATGDADLNRPRAFAIVSDISDNLKSHFEGSGDVTVSNPWPVPKIQSELELPRDERLDRKRPAPESDPEEKVWAKMARQIMAERQLMMGDHREPNWMMILDATRSSLPSLRR